MFLLIIAIYALIIFIEVPTFYKKNDNKKLIIYLSLIAIPIIIDVLLSINVEIPSPADGIKKIVLMIIGR
jgi:uncharacterized membrane protein YeiB